MAAAEPRFRGDSEANGCSTPVDLGGKGVYSSYTRELFFAHMDPEHISEIHQATNGNYALGSDRFQADIEQALHRRAMPGKSGRPTRTTISNA
jgi:putative transposase